MADDKTKLSDPAFRSADVPRTDDEFAALSTGTAIVDSGVSHKHSDDVVLAGEEEDASTAAASGAKEATAKDLIAEAKSEDVTDERLVELAADDRKTVSEAAKAVQDERKAAAASGTGSSSDQ